MNKSKAVKAAIAFKRGMAFVRGMQQLAQDAKAKKDEEIHWRTIGEGEEAHAVPIDGPEPNAKKAETKKVETKKAETKKAETKKAETKKAETKKAAEKKPAKIEPGTTYEIANGQPFTKESLDTIKSYFGSLDGNNDELSDDSSDQMSIWYSNGKFEVFTPESDPAELAQALNKKGIKMVVWDSGYGTTYCGSEKALQLRNPDTNEVKTLDELRREDLNPDSLWIVDDVVGRKETR
ncbi:MAG: hypothetical protein IIY58_05620 [Aeriscardovia sp.]|nr:hypothetical protein [Aeriscardovia sp.]